MTEKASKEAIRKAKARARAAGLEANKNFKAPHIKRRVYQRVYGSVLRGIAQHGGPCARLCGNLSRTGRTTCLACSELKVDQTMNARRQGDGKISA